MSASIRGTPCILPTSTQNTAPVHEYRCLYTHDLHKKAKKWHDGSLRFHTFNRRVMVYDDGKNYIGDLHYRQDDEFGEGVELQLDRGVKVEVGERVGETQTDLAPLLDRRKPEHASDARSPHAASGMVIHRIPAASSHRPRSIADVLGASQDRVGRARLPMQSPYEQRQALSSVQAAEPPTKRQRLASGKENTIEQPLQTKAGSPTLPPQRATKKAMSHAVIPVNAFIEFTEVFDISSDDEASKRLQERVRPSKLSTRAKAKVASSKQLQRVPRLPDTTANEKLAEPREASPIYTLWPIRRAASQLDEQTVSTTSAARLRSQPQLSMPSRISQTDPSKSGTSTLLLNAPKPRPKLLYKALLPPSKEPSVEVAAAKAVQNLPAGASRVVHEIRRPKTQSRGSPQQAIVSTEPSRPFLPSSSPSVHRTPEKVTQPPKSATPSPLFMPRSTTDKSPTGSGIATLDDFIVPSPTQTPSKQRHPARPHSEHSEREAESLSFSMRPAIDEQRPKSVLSQLDAILMRPPLTSQKAPTLDATSPSPRLRQFRRVLSENDTARNEEFEDDHSRISAIPNATHHRPPKTRLAMATTAKRPSPSKLRRTASDTAMLVERDEDSAPLELLASNEVGESGPWTSTEAYLLFDWWPPGRTKPDFGHPGPCTLLNGLPQPELPRIITARDVLRDDVNVL